MLCVFLLARLSHSMIPIEFRALADRALENSKAKVPLDKREDTKYPGQYNISGVTFQLKKILSAPISKDIKGYSKERNYIAIAKRKAFNLNEGFAFVEPSTQKVFQMNKMVASDDDVNIYSTVELTVFDILTNFRYRSGKGFNPEVKIELPLCWDTQNDQPELKDVPYLAPMQYGIGAYGSASVSCDFSFNSITDIMLTIDINLVLKAAAEFVIPNNFEKTFDEIPLFESSIKIPGLGFSFSFIGLECTFGAFFNYDAAIKDITLKIPYGFDYLKGYQLTGSKFIEITPFSITDSPWKFEASHIPERSSLQDIINSVLSATFEATLELRTYLHFEIDLIGINTEFNVGVALPFKATFGFDVVKCLSPYLYGQLNIPLQMFYEFSGIEIFGRSIVDEASDRYTVFEISPPAFCIGSKSNFKEGSPANIQPVSKDKYLITLDSCVDKDATSTEIQLVQEVVNAKNNDIIATRSRFYAIYDTKTYINDVIMFMDLDDTAELQWYFNYKVAGGLFTKKTDKMFILFKNIKYGSNDKGTIGTEIKEKGDFEIISSVTICKSASAEKVFTSGYAASVGIPTDNNYYGVIQFDTQGNPSFNLNAQFYSESMMDSKDRSTAVYRATKDQYELEFIDFQTDYSSVQIQMQFEIDGKNAFEVLTNKVGKGTNSASKLGITKKYPLKSTKQVIIYYSVDRGIFSSSTEGKITIPVGSLTENVDKIYTFSLHGDQDCDYIRFRFNSFVPKVAVTGLNPNVETIVTTFQEVKMPLRLIKIPLSFEEGSQYKIIRVVPSIKLDTNEVYAIYAPGIQALSKTATQISSDAFYDNIKSTKAIDIMIRRTETKKDSFDINMLVFKFAHKEDVNINPKGDEIYFDRMERPIGFVVPMYQGSLALLYLADNKYFLYNYYALKVSEDHVIFAMELVSSYSTTVRFAISYAFIPDNTPKLTFDTTYIGELFNDTTKDWEFTIYCNEKWAKMLRIGDKLYPVENGSATFPIQNGKHGVFTAYPICASDEGTMCEVTMNIPTTNSIQLFKFPSRDGISLTGLGMYSEFINTNSQTQITFIKSYKEMPVIVRGYSSNEEKVKMTIGYVTTPVHTNSDTRFRRFCLYDVNDNRIPFSRKYLDSNLDGFMAAAGISPDYNQIKDYYLTADDCVDVSADKVVTEKITSFPAEACDLNCPIEIEFNEEEEFESQIPITTPEEESSEPEDQNTENSKPDGGNIESSNSGDGQGGNDNDTVKVNTIIGTVVAIAFVAVAIAVAVYCKLRKRKLNEVKESESDSADSNSQGEV